MLKLLGKFGRAKRTIVMLAVCLAITVAVSFHDDIFFGKRNTTSTSTTITQADSPSKTERLWDLTEKMLMTICAVLIIHLFDQVYLMDEVIQNTKDALDTVVDRHIHLIDSSNKCGIADIYNKRASARKDIMDDIEDAKVRVWLLGVGLNVHVDVEDIIPNLRDKKKDGVDVRILMLDAFRSTAVFRTFLESSMDQAKRIIDYYEKLCMQDVSDPRERDVYFNERLCRRFESTCKALLNTPELEPCVKFYAHTPSCWLVITDSKAYFQPYTFGSLPPRQEISQKSEIHDTHTADETIGDLLPVFKFQSHKNIDTFKVLEDHFLKLWATSDCSLFHIQARQNDKEGILKRIFDTRREWLRHVYSVLYTTRGKESYDRQPGEVIRDKSGRKEYRLYERQICPEPVKVTFKFKQNGGKVFEGGIVDSSREGIAILTYTELSNSELKGSEVEVGLDPNKYSTHQAMLPNLITFLKQILLSENNSFEIRNIKSDNSSGGMRMGLKKVA
jgi:hypothetical protein